MLFHVHIMFTLQYAHIFSRWFTVQSVQYCPILRLRNAFGPGPRWWILFGYRRLPTNQLGSQCQPQQLQYNAKKYAKCQQKCNRNAFNYAKQCNILIHCNMFKNIECHSIAWHVWFCNDLHMICILCIAAACSAKSILLWQSFWTSWT
jgi:hypothetical protein